MGKTRKYPYSDVVMLTASQTIAESFRNYITELEPVRSNWSEEYADKLKQRIKTIITNDLGLKPAESLHEASTEVNKLIMNALRDLSLLKSQIKSDFRRETEKRDRLLRSLGLNVSFAIINHLSQEELVHLLVELKENMSDSLQEEIMSKGIGAGLIDSLIAAANALNAANLVQENLKVTTKVENKDIAELFNNIYFEIMGICAVAKRYYRFEPLKKEQFTFSRIIANLGGSKSSPKTDTQSEAVA